MIKTIDAWKKACSFPRLSLSLIRLIRKKLHGKDPAMRSFKTFDCHGFGCRFGCWPRLAQDAGAAPAAPAATDSAKPARLTTSTAARSTATRSLLQLLLPLSKPSLS